MIATMKFRCFFSDFSDFFFHNRASPYIDCSSPFPQLPLCFLAVVQRLLLLLTYQLLQYGSAMGLTARGGHVWVTSGVSDGSRGCQGNEASYFILGQKVRQSVERRVYVKP
jgi:hypothetical protein